MSTDSSDESEHLPPLLAALLATLFTWAVTALGAGLVYVSTPTKLFLDGSLGFAAGVMLAASYWSLLAPAIEIAESDGFGSLSFIPAAVGLVFGVAFVDQADKLLPMDKLLSGVTTSASAAHHKKTDTSAISPGSYADANANAVAVAEHAFSPTAIVEESARHGGSTKKKAKKSKKARGIMGFTSATRRRSVADSGDQLRTIAEEASVFESDEDTCSENEMDEASGKDTTISQQLYHRRKSSVDEAQVAVDDNTAGSISRESWHRTLMLALAVTVHNIPEGLAVGVAFGSIGHSATATYASAVGLAIGIAIQNFPEGTSVSVPLYRAGISKHAAFFYGQMSGIVEPFAGVIGCLFVELASPVLPYALGFAAGAMIYVVVDDIIPEYITGPHAKTANLFLVLGFIVMMSLDVGLG